jgi:hypothetical protein
LFGDQATMDQIESAETLWDLELPEYMETVMYFVGRAAGYDLLSRNAVVSDAPIEATINHGRWLAACEACGSAETLWIRHPVFMCQHCWNHAHDGRWRPVRFPADRATIERVLLLRPQADNRNWLPGETVESLEAENEGHGVSHQSLPASAEAGGPASVGQRAFRGELWLGLHSILTVPGWVKAGTATIILGALILFTVGRPLGLHRSHVPAIAGLFFDVWGATLVALPLMRRGADIALLTAPRLDFNPPLIRSFLRDRALGALGLVLLVFGFVLQTVAQLL